MALIIEIKVVPSSGRGQLCLDKSGILKCFVKAAPENGKANQEVIALVAQAASVIKKSIEIISGLTSRKKKLAIDTDMTLEQFLIKIGGGVQNKIFK